LAESCQRPCAVIESSQGITLSDAQDQTLALIRSLVSEGLLDVGDLSGEDGRFLAWDAPLKESMQRIYDMYVANFDDMSCWPWLCWLNLTEKGLEIARTIEEKC
jgi:hypothetical protein